MTLSPCIREKEVKELLARGGWPQTCSPELLAHLSGCRACGDLALVPETAGALWWRAQLRRRNAAVERVGRPILGAQIFALSVSLFIAVGFLTFQARDGLNLLSWLKHHPEALALHLEVLWPSALFSSGWSLALLIPVFATLALLSGVVVYLALEKQ